MSLRTDLLEVIDEVRSIGEKDGDIDTTLSQLTIRTRTWTGGVPGADGGYDDSDLILDAWYQVHELSQREINNSGGRYQAGDVSVGPITPYFIRFDGSEGGYTAGQLAPPTTAPQTTQGVEYIYILAGKLAGHFQLRELSENTQFGYTLILARRRETP